MRLVIADVAVQFIVNNGSEVASKVC